MSSLKKHTLFLLCLISLAGCDRGQNFINDFKENKYSHGSIVLRKNESIILRAYCSRKDIQVKSDNGLTASYGWSFAEIINDQLVPLMPAEISEIFGVSSVFGLHSVWTSGKFSNDNLFPTDEFLTKYDIILIPKVSGHYLVAGKVRVYNRYNKEDILTSNSSMVIIVE